MAYGPFNTGGSAPAGNGSAALNVSYDNAESGVESKNVQEALDTIFEKIKNLAQTIDTVPTQSGSLTYTGVAQSPAWNSYNPDMLEIGGVTTGTNAGTYTATFTPKDGYTWPDGTTDAKEVTWSIGRAVIGLPEQSASLGYTGSAQSPSWSGYDTEKMTLGGVTSGTNVGSYVATFTPKEGYEWSDGTTGAVEVTWTIGKAVLTVPSQSGSLTYTGNAQSPTWSNYDSAKMTISGTTSGTNAGSYTATFTPAANYQWPDGTATAKSATWTIGKASGRLSLSATTLTLDASSLSKTITATRTGNGAITASSSNTSVATVSVSGTTITVTAKAKGSATVTVNVAAGTNHTAPSSKTCAVTVTLPSTTLADNTPATIQAAAKAGTASTYWSVGDKIGIALSGTVGSLALSDTYYAFILGFDHNSTIEGTNSIHFQFGKTSTGTDIAFVDSSYGSTGSTAAFRMNTSNPNSGGWSSSYMRQTICPAFLAAMPTDWQNVIVACTKYSDNTGGGTNDASYVTSTSDKIWLLAECEVFGSRYGDSGGGYANDAEKNYQKQYDYYANGNAKTKYKHSSTGYACAWWLRSVSVTSTITFCRVYTNGTATSYNADVSAGFAPGFKVA